MLNRNAMKLSTVSDTPSLLVQANVVFLGAELMAAFERDADGYRFLVKPTTTDAPALSIADMVGQVNELIKTVTGKEDVLNSDTIAQQLDGVVQESANGVTDDIKVRLKQVFLYMDKKADPTKQAESSLEYAFDVEIESDIAPDFTLVNIHSVALAVWNTNRQSVLDPMQLRSLQDLLKDYQN